MPARRAADAESGAGAVLRIETALAEARLDSAAARDPKALIHVMSVAELQASTPSFDWKRYIAARRAPAFDQLVNSQPKVMERFERLLTDTPLDDIKQYLRWHLIHSAATMLPKAFGDADFEFFGRVLLGQREPQPRWRLCMSQTDEYLGDALGQGFVEETFRSEAKADTQAMIGYLKAALRRDIETADWMSEPTKRAALEKLAVVQDLIGHPDQWRDFSALQISRADAFGNLQRVRAAENARDLGQAGQPIDPAAWPITPQTANSGYIANLNTIIFPAGILQPPIYDAARDAAVNYGAAASLIGHELTHGFDDAGKRFDAKGNVREWWTPADAKAFDERAACMVDEYSQFVVAGDTRINGKLTLGENIADNGGLRLALMAYFAGPGSGRAAGARRLRGRSAGVPRLRAILVSDHHGGIRAGLRRHQRACRQPLPRQRRRLEHAGVPEGVRVPGRRAHGSRKRLPRLVVVGDAVKTGTLRHSKRSERSKGSQRSQRSDRFGRLTPNSPWTSRTFGTSRTCRTSPGPARPGDSDGGQKEHRRRGRAAADHEHVRDDRADHGRDQHDGAEERQRRHEQQHSRDDFDAAGQIAEPLTEANGVERLHHRLRPGQL